jgi:hypothetical protein
MHSSTCVFRDFSIILICNDIRQSRKHEQVLYWKSQLQCSKYIDDFYFRDTIPCLLDMVIELHLFTRLSWPVLVYLIIPVYFDITYCTHDGK